MQNPHFEESSERFQVLIDAFNARARMAIILGPDRESATRLKKDHTLAHVLVHSIIDEFRWNKGREEQRKTRGRLG